MLSIAQIFMNILLPIELPVPETQAGGWTFGLISGLVLFLICIGSRFLASRFLHAAIEQGKNTWRGVLADCLHATTPFVLFLIALFFAGLLSPLPDRMHGLSRSLLMIAIFFQVGVWGDRFLVFLITHSPIMQKEKGLFSRGTLPMIIIISRIIYWVVVGLFLLDNLGYDIAALVAGLGVGGIAVALASKNILSDLFASFSILFDRPFSVGDFLIIGDSMGKVESIGLKTTRIRSLNGEQLIFANNDLLASRIKNYRGMRERRVTANIGVILETDQGKMQRIPELIKEIIDREEEAAFSRAHLKEYGPYALIYEVVYYVKSGQYMVFMDIQERINLRIYEVFQREGIEFAYPTSKVFLQSVEKNGDQGHA